MTSTIQAPAFGRASASPGRLAIVAVAALAVVLSGCGEQKKDKAATQVAAKVNKEEISVHQINFLLQQQRGLRAEQAEAAGRVALERLIDQELALQKALEQKLDREPRVVQQIEAARREIIARAYVEKIGEAATKPTPEEVQKYFTDKPALFKERRIYNLQEISIEAKPEQLPGLRTQLQASKSINEFVDFLKAIGYRFNGNSAVRAAEQLPLSTLDTFAKMKDGQAMLVAAPAGAQVIVLAGSRSEPVDEARARPAIEQFLWNDAKRKLVEADRKAMRESSKIEYMGKFAQGAASAPAAAPAPAETPAVEPVALPASAAAPGLSDADISKGMGIKK